MFNVNKDPFDFISQMIQKIQNFEKKYLPVEPYTQVKIDSNLKEKLLNSGYTEVEIQRMFNQHIIQKQPELVLPIPKNFNYGFVGVPSKLKLKTKKGIPKKAKLKIQELPTTHVPEGYEHIKDPDDLDKYTVLPGRDSYNRIYGKPKNNTPENLPEMEKNAILDGYNMSSYATNPEHNQKLQQIRKGMGKINDDNGLENYLNKFEGTPITAEHVKNTSQKYEVPWETLITIMRQDSNLGREGIGAKTKNPGNIGNDDAGNVVSYDSWQEGVNAIGNWLNKHKVK